ncbi:mycofactocin-coupled SDR family oxidoreductase [Nocardioides sp. SLBN-35]|jgi:SDR family mycofactocin-dependent oxidoreductase|uniref:mycofactocin-coupled SDR family oxidoreductase n=1 Tax=Nocardioides sp. SLBN-35 TaxID=2768445 RepID=UPI0011525B80|nr:mycofactocin-coupled SDR family oxidoreductase [Nocardioides sp. SLBN-35]TQK69090.1 SDR family mycofactocin-dependent oxidoreductase [Nocardioides sp. SLBN-35]
MTRVVLVTGAARGIGAATVRRLVARGDRVVAVDELTIAETDPQVLPVVADVRDRSALAAAVDLAIETWGRLDAAVAAAAVVAGGRPLWETPEADLDLLWDVDVKGVWNTAAVTVPAMLAGPDPSGCRFVAVASAAGHHGLHHLAAYNAAKHAVIGLVKGLAADLVGTGVTACAVSPGSTRTPMLEATAALYGLDDVDTFADNQLLRRILEPEEVAAALVFCCSSEAAVLNGSVVRADGGFAP